MRKLLYSAIGLILIAGAYSGYHYAKADLYGTGLVGYWDLDSNDIDWTTGRVTDNSGNGNTAIVQLMSTTTSPAIGKQGQGLIFLVNDNSAVTIASTPASLSLSTLSISMWFKAITPSAWTALNPIFNGVLLGTGILNNNKGFNLSCFASNISIQRNIVGDNEQIQDADAFNPCGDTHWNHLVITITGTTVLMYVNGVQTSTTGTWSGSIQSYTGAIFSIGRRTDVGQSYNGVIDDVRVYNRVITATEVRTLYFQGISQHNTSGF